MRKRKTNCPSLVGPTALTRLCHINVRLASAARLTACTLAEELGVSVRTIKRDIDILRDSHGADIRWDATAGTYVCTRPSEHLPLLRISADEAIAVALAGRTFAAWAGSPLGRALESVLGKVAEVVGNDVTLPANTIAHCIYQPDEPAGADATRQHFGRLLDAIRRRRTLRLLYRKPGAATAEERLVDPLHLAYLDHDWLLVAFDHSRGALRSFLITRIEESHLTARGFLPPENFDAQQYFAGAFGRYSGGPLKEVRLRFDAYAAPFIRERRWHPSQVLTDLPDGGVEVALRVNHLLDVQRWVLSWGAHAEALAPTELRTAVASEIAVLAARYKP